jgi:phage recombination protein Bet
MTTDLATTTQHPVAANMPVEAQARGITPESWNVLRTILFKDAEEATILTLIDYCKARKLDPLKRPFHIVKVWNNETRRLEDSIWPGIGELRTTAMRTGEYAGKAEIRFGPDQTKTWGDVTVTFPEWAQATVYRMIHGQRVEFAGSPVYWLETYASVKGGAPNAMWKKRPRGQLAKCAEAEALRSAFPEEVGSEPTAEEMEGQTVGGMRDVTPPTETPAPAELPQTSDAPATVEVYDHEGLEHAGVAPSEADEAIRAYLAKCETHDDVANFMKANTGNPAFHEELLEEARNLYGDKRAAADPEWAQAKAAHDPTFAKRHGITPAPNPADEGASPDPELEV